MKNISLIVVSFFMVLTSFTGCIEDLDLEPVEKVDEIKDESDNTNNIVDEINNTEEKTEERPTNQWTFYRDFVECDTNNNSIVAYGEFVDCLNMDLVNDGESMVAASSEFANEVFSMADLDVDGNLTSSEFDYIKNYPHEAEEGCMDSNANNFNANATEEDNTCDYDLDDDGVLDVDEILGCTDSTALNYNSEATDEDGTCFYFQPQTTDELETAVDEWIANSTSANSTYGEINTWDTSLITDMSYLFYDTSFNGDISDWDVSSVKYMNDMFWKTTEFNQSLSSWDVSSVTDMSYMFGYAGSFNQDISAWDVSSVTGMGGMFSSTSFNQDISDWDVSSVTFMGVMFSSTESFNQPLSGWDVSSVTNMKSMFAYAESFNQDISDWDVSSVTNMYAMFYYAYNFDQDISDWDVSSVTNMGLMFDNTDDLSDDNKCYIHTSFSSNDNWEYYWEEYCEGSNQSHDISITDNMKFDPEELTISVGDTVTWTNNDGISHTATSTDGPESFDSGNMGSGDTWSFTFTEAGTYEYKCNYHSSQTGRIIVNA
ncbi:MAG TPA: BspA family leucine-rich repeat surface protein [Marine Group III euryarchaeote]|uniref:BspA family leucine-rich repeat surface protein n=1 Tax=Marine Group III euryarchaeote TaxID=2173149 RepID=A0A7J4GS52_9ARCH|nr:BspA family leucine-rich repeat surface protein [Marine Group III euryarchaeote]